MLYALLTSNMHVQVQGVLQASDFNTLTTIPPQPPTGGVYNACIAMHTPPFLRSVYSLYVSSLFFQDELTITMGLCPIYRSHLAAETWGYVYSLLSGCLVRALCTVVRRSFGIGSLLVLVPCSRNALKY